MLDKRKPTHGRKKKKNAPIPLTKISVYRYAPVATGRPKALVPSGNERI